MVEMDYMFMRDVAEVELMDVLDIIERTSGHGTPISCTVKGAQDLYVAPSILTFEKFKNSMRPIDADGAEVARSAAEAADNNITPRTPIALISSSAGFLSLPSPSFALGLPRLS